MKVCIVGIGAMGCLFAARLSDLAEVRMIGHWKEQISVLSNHGLVIVRADGSKSKHAIVVSEDITQPNTYDLVLVLVKGWQSQQAAEVSKKLIAESGLLLTLQNGLGNLEIMAGSVGIERAIQGVTSEGATLLSPGVIRHAGAGTTYLAKTLETEQRLVEILTLFREAEFDTHLIDSPDSLIWGKLAVNAGINPLTGLLQVPNGYLVTHGAARRLMRKAAIETEAVALAQNISLPFPNAADQAIRVAKATATNRSSMAQDVARDAPTEIDSICGAIIRLGRKFHIPTPVNEALLQLLKIQTEHGNWLDHIDSLSLEVKVDFRALATEYQDSKK